MQESNIPDRRACLSFRVSLLSGSCCLRSFSDDENSSAVSKLSPELIWDILPNRRSLQGEIIRNVLDGSLSNVGRTGLPKWYQRGYSDGM